MHRRIEDVDRVLPGSGTGEYAEEELPSGVKHVQRLDRTESKPRKRGRIVQDAGSREQSGCTDWRRRQRPGVESGHMKSRSSGVWGNGRLFPCAAGGKTARRLSPGKK